MINKKIGVLLLFALLVSFGAKAQRATLLMITANAMPGSNCSTIRPVRSISPVAT